MLDADPGDRLRHLLLQERRPEFNSLPENPALTRIWVATFVLTFVALPQAALAQDMGGLGLDLSGDAQKKDTAKDKKAGDKGSNQMEGLDLTTPTSETSSSASTTTPTTAVDANAPTPATTPEATADAPPPKEEPALFNEADITSEDRVKSVQRKVYLKKGRFELAPFVTVSLNDPFFTKFGGSLRGAYFLADTLAIAARFSYYQFIRSDDLKTAGRVFQAIPSYSVPQESLLFDAEWSPLYGKIAIFNSILHFDAYLLGGVGAMVTETSKLPGRPAADLGAGVRFVVTDFLAVNVNFINTAFVDTPAAANGKASTQNMLTLNAGVSIFFPFSSTGREAE